MGRCLRPFPESLPMIGPHYTKAVPAPQNNVAYPAGGLTCKRPWKRCYLEFLTSASAYRPLCTNDPHGSDICAPQEVAEANFYTFNPTAVAAVKNSKFEVTNKGVLKYGTPCFL